MFRREELPSMLWDKKWERRIQEVIPGLSSPISQSEIEFLNNLDISPLVRYLFVWASYNEGEAIVKQLSSEEKVQLKDELEKTVLPKYGFSGRLWMSHMLLTHIAQHP